MTLHDVERLYRYWRGTPPLRDIVAAFVGVKDGAEKAVAPAMPEIMEFEE